jgi:hypothetical protein
MTNRKFHSRAIFRFPWLPVLMAIGSLSPVLAQSDDRAPAAQPVASGGPTMQAGLAELRALAISPEERAARMEVLMQGWRQAQARQLAEQRVQQVAGSTDEATQAMAETKTMARSPQEAAQLTEELFRLNPAIFAMPASPGAAGGLAQARAYLQTRSDVAADFGDALLEARQQARTPEEAAGVVEQLFKLNPQTTPSIPSASR